jgi:hypothetical protein
VGERLDVFAGLLALLERRKTVSIQREAEPTRRVVESTARHTPWARFVPVATTALQPKQGANGDPVIGVLQPNRFVGHALNIAFVARGTRPTILERGPETLER